MQENKYNILSWGGEEIMGDKCGDLTIKGKYRCFFFGLKDAPLQVFGWSIIFLSNHHSYFYYSVQAVMKCKPKKENAGK